MRISFELSDMMHVYSREHYTFFELVSDIGGAQSIIVLIPTYLVGFWALKMYERKMASDTTISVPKQD